MTRSELFERILNEGIATESEINLVTDIAGYSIETLNQIIYVRTGYRDIEQYEEVMKILNSTRRGHGNIEQYEESEIDAEPDDIDDDTGFDPFMGEYTFDC